MNRTQSDELAQRGDTVLLHRFVELLFIDYVRHMRIRAYLALAQLRRGLFSFASPALWQVAINIDHRRDLFRE